MVRWSIEPRQTKEKPPEHSENLPVICPTCGVHTNARVMYWFLTYNNRFIQLPINEMVIYNYLLCCTRCKSAILLMWSYGKLDLGTQGTYAFTTGKHIYPVPESAFEINTLPKESIPDAILEDLRQAELSFHSGAFYGAGLLLRRACQNICGDQQIPGKPGGLKAQINEMANLGIINKKLAELVLGIRIIGNEIAHPDAYTPFIITSQDIEIAREFILQLVRSIYVDPVRA